MPESLKVTLRPFDAAAYIRTPDEAATYIAIVMDDHEGLGPQGLDRLLDTVVRAQGESITLGAFNRMLASSGLRLRIEPDGSGDE